MKTSELQGAALDWAVAKCIYEPDDVVICDGRVFAYDDATKGFNPSTDWTQGGPIIEREGIHLASYQSCWTATLWKNPNLRGNYGSRAAHEENPIIVLHKSGETPLIAAMRVYVARKLGEEVEVPHELA